MKLKRVLAIILVLLLAMPNLTCLAEADLSAAPEEGFEEAINQAAAEDGDQEIGASPADPDVPEAGEMPLDDADDALSLSDTEPEPEEAPPAGTPQAPSEEAVEAVPVTPADDAPADAPEKAPEDAEQEAEAASLSEGGGAEAPEGVEPFDQSALCDGVVVTVRAEPGVFPAGAELSVTRVLLYEQRQAEAAVDEVRSEGQNVAARYTFEIRVLDAEGIEVQPAEGRTVQVSFAMAEVADENLKTNVYHIADDMTAQKLDVTAVDADTAVVATEGFSIYTVEFTYNTLQYVLEGGGSVALAAILEEVGLTGEAEAVAVSDASLFDAVLRDGAWVVESCRAFDSEEWMKVTINAQVYEITVTDATDSVEYVDENGEDQTRNNVNYVQSDSTSWRTGWYAVTETTTIEDRITVTGNVNLILCDGATLTAEEGITVTGNNSLTIWAQSCGTGALYAGTTNGYDYTCNKDCAGIGGGDAKAGGNITINGGNVTAKGGEGGAGIGGGFNGDGGTVKITGGTVEAEGGTNGAGIGGGNGGAGGTLRLDLSGAADGDYLKADSYNCTVNVEDADGKPVYVKDENGKIYTGTLTDAEKSAAAGNTLVYAALTPWQKLQAAIDRAGTTATEIKVSDYAENGSVTAGDGDAALIVDEGQDITLDLEGCTLDRGLKDKDAVNNGNVITVKGSLTVKDSKGGSAITGGNNAVGGGVYMVGASSEFNLSGGTISGNTAITNGGGVFVLDGKFEMTGGTISGNKATDSGGGVNVTGTDGTFSMSGGTVSGNTASGCGGGVHVIDGTFTMSGGTVSGNTANGDGGGVYVKGTFNISGAPEVTGNKIGLGAANNVYLPNGKTITVDTALTDGARIDVTMKTPGAFTSGSAGFTGETAKKYFIPENAGYTISVKPMPDGTTQATLAVAETINSDNIVTGHATIGDAFSACNDSMGETIRLLTDVTTDSTLSTSGRSVTLDLNGYGILMTGEGSVIEVPEGGSLTLTDGRPDATHYITLDDDGRGTAVSETGTEGEKCVKVTGGYITGGRTTSCAPGGGVVVENELTMKGGTITGNRTVNTGGVYVDENAVFIMAGGRITRNTAFHFGGVYVEEKATFKMTGGEITDNTAKYLYGGVVLLDGATFELSGSPVIKENTDMNGPSNVYLDEGCRITITGALNNEDAIGITMGNPGVFTEGLKGNGQAAGFKSDDAAYAVIANADGEAELVVPVTGTITVKKDLTGRGWTAEDSFTFTLLKEGASVDTVTINKDTANHTAAFGDITFTEPGEYVFTVSEANGGQTVDGIAYDGDKTVTIVVVRDGQGGLKAAEGSTMTPEVTFTNRFSPAKATLKVKKDFSDWSKADSFTFTLSPVTQGAPMPASDKAAATEAAPEAAFDEIAYDAEGRWDYTITEEKERRSDIEYDETAHQVTVTVTKDASNALTASVKYDGADSLTVTNHPLYAVDCETAAGGSVAAEPTLVRAGQTITVTVKANDGYVPDGVTCTQGVVPIKVDDATYTFSMPAADVTVTGAFITEWAALQRTLDAGGTVALDRDYKANNGAGDAALIVKGSVALDLNGHAIDRNLTDAAKGGNVITVDGSLTVIDGKGGGKITGGNNLVDGGGVIVNGTFKLAGGALTGNICNCGGGVYVADGGAFSLSGGAITGNTAVANGGGVYVAEAAFDMTGGAIENNLARDDSGGGVFAGEASAFSMTGGRIADNTAGSGGGGLFVFQDNQSATVGGGTISGNRSEFVGGGVYIDDCASLGIGGNAVIAENNASRNGGGAFVYGEGVLAISGAPTIAGNTAGSGTANNVWLDEDTVITVTDRLNGASVGVTTDVTPGPEDGKVQTTSGLKGRGDLSAFSSDDARYVLGWDDAGGEAVLGLVIAHSATGYEGVYDGAGHGITVAVTAPEAGYEVKYGTAEGVYDLGACPMYTDVGAHTVYYKVSAKGSFDAVGSAVVTIAKATLTVTADAATKVEGEADPALTYTVKGLVGDDRLTGALSREAGELPGSYAITQGTLKASDNYAMTFTGASLTIKPKPEIVLKGDFSVLPVATVVSPASVALDWAPMPGAEGYDVFFTRCGKKSVYQLKASVTADAQNSCTVDGLKTGTPYKAYLMPWRIENGVKTYIGKASPTVHVIAGGENKNYCNAKKVTVQKAALTVKVGRRKKILAGVRGAVKGKKVLKHAKKLRFFSSDRDIATVDSRGRVKGISPGTCTIYAVANNGRFSTVTVTVMEVNGKAVK